MTDDEVIAAVRTAAKAGLSAATKTEVPIPHARLGAAGVGDHEQLVRVGGRRVVVPPVPSKARGEVLPPGQPERIDYVFPRSVVFPRVSRD